MTDSPARIPRRVSLQAALESLEVELSAVVALETTPEAVRQDLTERLRILKAKVAKES